MLYKEKIITTHCVSCACYCIVNEEKFTNCERARKCLVKEAYIEKLS